MLRAIPIFRAGLSLSFRDPGAGSGPPVATVLYAFLDWSDRPRLDEADDRITLPRIEPGRSFSAMALVHAARARAGRLRLIRDTTHNPTGPARKLKGGCRSRTLQSALKQLVDPQTGATLRPNRWARRRHDPIRRRPAAVHQAELWPERQTELFAQESAG